MEKIIDVVRPNILSEISRDIGQVFFAGVVVEPIISKNTSLIVFISGLLLSICFWIFSIKITKFNL